jgi:DNA repair protein RecN (Recombination protein N)
VLTSLTIKNFTLVDHLDLEFAPGMTAITGETGAGKSLVLGALAMALGDRGDSDRIRAGADRAEVSASFTIANNPLAAQWLADNDLGDGDECLLRRTLTAEGRSRGFINGQPATMQQLQQLGELMIDIHSQHEHQSLLKRDTHRRLLDLFADGGQQADEVARLHGDWHRVQRQLEQRESHADEIAARQVLLQFQLEELDALDLGDQELDALEREQHRLANAEQILRDSHAALGLCRDAEEGDILSLLGQVQHLLEAAGETGHLAEAAALVASARIQVDEAAREIQRHVDSFELNPERLAEVEERLSLAYQIARKHRIQPQGLPELRRSLRDELDALCGGQGGIEALREQAAALEKHLNAAELRLSALRAKAAPRFAAAVNEQLASLAMGSATLVIDLAPLGGHGASGREAVEFLLSTNPGQPHRPLARIASGGELSRISLAIQVVAARHTAIPTLVFDEVDVGIGGAVAEVVGRLLRQLGRDGQVICVTHLPQVASCAHHHLVASKRGNGKGMESRLDQLSPGERVQEIARMLGGATITAQTLAHAEEMLSLSAPA